MLDHSVVEWNDPQLKMIGHKTTQKVTCLTMRSCFLSSTLDYYFSYRSLFISGYSKAEKRTLFACQRSYSSRQCNANNTRRIDDAAIMLLFHLDAVHQLLGVVSKTCTQPEYLLDLDQGAIEILCHH